MVAAVAVVDGESGNAVSATSPRSSRAGIY